jgi:hypothetical protein
VTASDTRAEMRAGRSKETHEVRKPEVHGGTEAERDERRQVERTSGIDETSFTKTRPGLPR